MSFSRALTGCQPIARACMLSHTLQRTQGAFLVDRTCIQHQRLLSQFSKDHRLTGKTTNAAPAAQQDSAAVRTLHCSAARLSNFPTRTLASASASLVSRLRCPGCWHVYAACPKFGNAYHVSSPYSGRTSQGEKPETSCHCVQQVMVPILWRGKLSNLRTHVKCTKA